MPPGKFADMSPQGLGVHAVEPTLEQDAEFLHAAGTRSAFYDFISIMFILSIHVNYPPLILNLFLTRTVSRKECNNKFRCRQ